MKITKKEFEELQESLEKGTNSWVLIGKCDKGNNYYVMKEESGYSLKVMERGFEDVVLFGKDWLSLKELIGEYIEMEETGTELVNHPTHYGGKDNPYEAIKVIEAWQLGFRLGNTVKYIARAGKKDAELKLKDLKKAQWYLNREIELLK
jgi:hypothetical protein